MSWEHIIHIILHICISIKSLPYTLHTNTKLIKLIDIKQGKLGPIQTTFPSFFNIILLCIWSTFRESTITCDAQFCT